MTRPDSPIRMRAGAGLLALAAALAMTGVASAAASDNSQPCFFLHAWDGQWKVSKDSRALYVKENGSIFRLDLQQPIPMLQSAWAIINTQHSSDAVCRPEDLHLVVSDRLGGKDFPIVKRITKLTTEEVAALPKNLKLR